MTTLLIYLSIVQCNMTFHIPYKSRSKNSKKIEIMEVQMISEKKINNLEPHDFWPLKSVAIYEQL